MIEPHDDHNIRANARIVEESQAPEHRLHPRKQPRQERARATVAAIKEAAGQLLVERGYARVSTNLIARRAGVSVGSLYQYFPGKEAIYAALVDDHRRDMHARAGRALALLADVSVPFDDGLRFLLEEMSAARGGENAALLGLIEVELAHVAPDRPRGGGEDDRFVAETEALLEARPDCAPAHAHAAAVAVVGCCVAVIRWLVHAAPPGADPLPYLDAAVAACCAAAGFRA